MVHIARRRIECGTLHVAVADRPDLRPPTVPLGVARIGAPVGHEAHQLAQVIARVLRLGAREVALAQRHEQRAVGREDDARAIMRIRRIGWLLAEDDLKALEARAIGLRDQFGTRHAGAVLGSLARLGKGEIDQSRRGEIGGKRHVQQPTLATGVDPWRTLHRRRQRAACGNDSTRRRTAISERSCGHQD